eukprot:4701488-Amphidinium_carterae.1
MPRPLSSLPEIGGKRRGRQKPPFTQKQMSLNRVACCQVRRLYRRGRDRTLAQQALSMSEPLCLHGVCAQLTLPCVLVANLGLRVEVPEELSRRQIRRLLECGGG